MGLTMELSLTAQGILIVYAAAVGVLAGFLFDFFRILRIAFGGKAIAVFFEDLLYWTLLAAGVFLFFLFFNNGQVRLYCFPAIAVGATAYFLSLSPFLMRFSRFFINKLKKFIKFILQLASKPIIIVRDRAKSVCRSSAAKVKAIIPRRTKVKKHVNRKARKKS